MKRSDIEPRRKRRRPARRDDDDDDSFLIGASSAPMDRKTQYDWQVIDDPEACFQGGIFRWIDLKMSAQERTWPVGIRFQNVHDGRVLCFDGETLLEQEALPLAPAQTQAKRPYPVYAWKKTVTMASDQLYMLFSCAFYSFAADCAKVTLEVGRATIYCSVRAVSIAFWKFS